MNHFAAVLVLAALMAIARWGPIQDLIQIEHRATVSLGFILIFGYLVGHFARRLSLVSSRLGLPLVEDPLTPWVLA